MESSSVKAFGLIDQPNGTWIACNCGRVDTLPPKNGYPISEKDLSYRPTSKELWEHYLKLGWIGTPDNCLCPDCNKKDK